MRASCSCRSASRRARSASRRAFSASAQLQPETLPITRATPQAAKRTRLMGRLPYEGETPEGFIIHAVRENATGSRLAGRPGGVTIRRTFPSQEATSMHPKDDQDRGQETAPSGVSPSWQVTAICSIIVIFILTGLLVTLCVAYLAEHRKDMDMQGVAINSGVYSVPYGGIWPATPVM